MVLYPWSISHVMQRYLACKPLMLSDLLTYFKIHLQNRKGWQRKVDKGQSETDLRGELSYCSSLHLDNVSICVLPGTCYQVYP